MCSGQKIIRVALVVRQFAVSLIVVPIYLLFYHGIATCCYTSLCVFHVATPHCVSSMLLHLVPSMLLHLSCLPCCYTSLQTLCCLCWCVYVSMERERIITVLGSWERTHEPRVCCTNAWVVIGVLSWRLYYDGIYLPAQPT